MEFCKHTLIVTADDFGLTPSVSEGIVELIDLGVASRTSAMMCEPQCGSLIEMYKHSLLGRCGVHLQLTKSTPLSPNNLIPSLVNEHGKFPSKENLSSVSLSELEHEWRAQIKKLKQHHIGVSHIDSHQNVHLMPEFHEIAILLGSEIRVSIRRAANQLNSALGSYSSNICLRNWTLTEQPAEVLVEEIYSIVENVDSTITIEIVTHPGRVDDLLKEVSSATDIREYELMQLRRLPHLLEGSKFRIL